MATAMQSGGRNSGYVARSSSSGLYDVLELILDKGLVIDVFVRVSLVGIELLTIDARIVIASVDTYLRFADAVSRLDLTETETSGIPELMEDIGSSGAKGKTSGAIEGAKEKLSGLLPGGDDDEDEDDDGEEEKPRRKRPSSKSSQSSQRRRSSSSRREE